MGNVIDVVMEDINSIKICLFGSDPPALVQNIDLRKKFASISLSANDKTDAEKLLLDNEMLDIVGNFPLFCTSEDETLFNKLIVFVEEKKLQFVTWIENDDFVVCVIRPKD